MVQSEFRTTCHNIATIHCNHLNELHLQNKSSSWHVCPWFCCDWQMCLFVKLMKVTLCNHCWLLMCPKHQDNNASKQVKFFSLTEVLVVKMPRIHLIKWNHYKGLGLTPRTGGSPVRIQLLALFISLFGVTEKCTLSRESNTGDLEGNYFPHTIQRL